MLQLHTCVSVWCDRCGDSPGEVGVPAHWATEAAALSGIAALGWRIGDRRLLCPACLPVVACDAGGHEFTVWYRPRRCGCDRGLPHHPGGAGGCGLEFRYCTRCGHDESRYAGLGSAPSGTGAVA